MEIIKAFQQMQPLQKIFLFIALATVLCSILTDCFLCKYWPLTVNARLRNPFEHFEDASTRLVLYSVGWCKFCQNLKADTWPQVETAFSGTDVKVEEVDAEANAEEAKAANVTGYPSIRLYKDGKMLSYEGERTAESIKAWVDSQ